MPTAAKLVAALLFGALAWAASRMAEDLAAEDADLAWFAVVNAAVGAVTGWRVAGRRAGTTVAGAVGVGISAAVAMTAVALLLHGFAAMLRRSLRRLYDGPVEALAAAVEITLGQAAALGTPAVLATLLAGGAAAGLLVEWVGRRFG